ncbi:MAG: replication initiator protein [Microvirus sp.]|nr:MAG: replication initiator protein [Microvirus sp.]
MPECMNPFVINRNNDDRETSVPCGKCPTCYARRVSQWSFRLMQQQKQSISSHFITLTYDTEHIPINEQGFRTLQKTDLQKFFKRLRKINSKSARGKHARDNGLTRAPKISYYAVGEYGGRTHRPHYHIIMFNSKPDDIIAAWSLDGVHLGSVHFGECTEASVGYCLKYMSKLSRIGHGDWDTRQKQFAIMSKGLGAGYLTPSILKWHHADVENRMYCNLPDQKKIGMPIYYKNKIYDKETRETVGQLTRARQLTQKDRKVKTPEETASTLAAAQLRLERDDRKGRSL